jgi:hypothetical protein
MTTYKQVILVFGYLLVHVNFCIVQSGLESSCCVLSVKFHPSPVIYLDSKDNVRTIWQPMEIGSCKILGMKVANLERYGAHTSSCECGCACLLRNVRYSWRSFFPPMCLAVPENWYGRIAILHQVLCICGNLAVICLWRVEQMMEM